MDLLTDDITAKMVENGRTEASDENADLVPVIKLFNPAGKETWLLTSLDPDDHAHAYGLCDLGMGEPELGFVDMGSLTAIRNHLGLGIERDVHWTGTHRLSDYARMAWKAGSIVDRLPLAA